MDGSSSPQFPCACPWGAAAFCLAFKEYLQCQGEDVLRPAQTPAPKNQTPCLLLNIPHSPWDFLTFKVI